MLNIFGSNYEEIGHLDRNLVLNTLGKVKIRYNRKFIDLLDENGNINAKFPKVINTIQSSSEMKKDGFYLLGDTLYAYIDKKQIKLSSNEQEFIESLLDLKLNSSEIKEIQTVIGLAFPTLRDALNVVEDGIVFVNGEIYVIKNGNAEKYLKSPLDEINKLGEPESYSNVGIIYDGNWKFGKIVTEDLFKTTTDNLQEQIQNLSGNQQSKDSESVYEVIYNSIEFIIKDLGDNLTPILDRDPVEGVYVLNLNLDDNNKNVIIPIELTYTAGQWTWQDILNQNTDIITVGNKSYHISDYKKLLLNKHIYLKEGLKFDKVEGTITSDNLEITKTGIIQSNQAVLSDVEVKGVEYSTEYPKYSSELNQQLINEGGNLNNNVIPTTQWVTNKISNSQSDWNATSGLAEILNKPTFKTINGENIIGTGNITLPENVIEEVSVNGTPLVPDNKSVNIQLKTVNGSSIVGIGNISISGGGGSGGDVNVIEAIKAKSGSSEQVVPVDENKIATITLKTIEAKSILGTGNISHIDKITAIAINGSDLEISPSGAVNIDLTPYIKGIKLKTGEQPYVNPVLLDIDANQHVTLDLTSIFHRVAELETATYTQYKVYWCKSGDYVQEGFDEIDPDDIYFVECVNYCGYARFPYYNIYKDPENEWAVFRGWTVDWKTSRIADDTAIMAIWDYLDMYIEATNTPIDGQGYFSFVTYWTETESGEILNENLILEGDGVQKEYKEDGTLSDEFGNTYDLIPSFNMTTPVRQSDNKYKTTISFLQNPFAHERGFMFHVYNEDRENYGNYPLRIIQSPGVEQIIPANTDYLLINVSPTNSMDSYYLELYLEMENTNHLIDINNYDISQLSVGKCALGSKLDYPDYNSQNYTPSFDPFAVEMTKYLVAANSHNSRYGEILIGLKELCKKGFVSYDQENLTFHLYGNYNTLSTDTAVTVSVKAYDKTNSTPTTIPKTSSDTFDTTTLTETSITSLNGTTLDSNIYSRVFNLAESDDISYYSPLPRSQRYDNFTVNDESLESWSNAIIKRHYTHICDLVYNVRSGKIKLVPETKITGTYLSFQFQIIMYDDSIEIRNETRNTRRMRDTRDVNVNKETHELEVQIVNPMVYYKDNTLRNQILRSVVFDYSQSSVIDGQEQPLTNPWCRITSYTNSGFFIEVDENTGNARYCIIRTTSQNTFNSEHAQFDVRINQAHGN